MIKPIKVKDSEIHRLMYELNVSWDNFVRDLQKSGALSSKDLYGAFRAVSGAKDDLDNFIGRPNDLEAVVNIAEIEMEQNESWHERRIT